MAPPIPPNPKKRDRRMMLYLGGGVLLLVLLIASRREQAQAADPAAAPDSTALTPSAFTPASTFADNGAQAAGLGDQITSALQANTDQTTAALGAVSDALGNLATTPDSTTTADPFTTQSTALLGLFKGLSDILKPPTAAANPQAKKGPAGPTRINPSNQVQNWWWGSSTVATGWHRTPPPPGANTSGAPKPKPPAKPARRPTHTTTRSGHSSAQGRGHT
jgi:hypothetical protein